MFSRTWSYDIVADIGGSGTDDDFLDHMDIAQLDALEEEVFNLKKHTSPCCVTCCSMLREGHLVTKGDLSYCTTYDSLTSGSPSYSLAGILSAIIVLNPFYYPIKSLSLPAKWAFKHQDLHMFGLKLTNISSCHPFNPLTAKLFNLNFHSLEVVSRWRDPQLQVSENLCHMFKISGGT